MADLIVKSAVKEQLDGMNVAADFYDASASCGIQ